MKSGNLNFLEPSGPLQASNGTALPYIYLFSKLMIRHWWTSPLFLLVHPKKLFLTKVLWSKSHSAAFKRRPKEANTFHVPLLICIWEKTCRVYKWYKTFFSYLRVLVRFCFFFHKIFMILWFPEQITPNHGPVSKIFNGYIRQRCCNFCSLHIFLFY
jgi:hypothetical protein